MEPGICQFDYEIPGSKCLSEKQGETTETTHNTEVEQRK